MYIYEMNASTTAANQRFAVGEEHLIWMFSTEDLQDRFAHAVLQKLQPMGWADIQLKRKLYSHDDVEKLTFRADGADIKNAFETALRIGTAWLIFVGALEPDSRRT